MRGNAFEDLEMHLGVYSLENSLVWFTKATLKKLAANGWDLGWNLPACQS